MNTSGTKPKKKKIKPELMMLKVNPDNIFNNMCPDKILAARRSPRLTFLDKYDKNSINTNKGNKPKGHPAGTNKEKNASLCSFNPMIVAPKTTVKLRENVNTTCDVDAKLYGTIPIKLFISININNTYIKGKYTCPFLLFIWLVTILTMVAYRDSILKDQLLNTSLL
jgi:hypothetical protein